MAFMGRNKNAILVALLFVLPLPGKILAAPLDGSAGLGNARLAETVCVPPGAPPFSSWQAKRTEPVVLIDEHGRPVAGLFVAYDARGQRLHAIWVGSLLASVDVAPDDKTAPAWYDRGVSAVSTAVRADPKQTCLWYRPPPKAKDADT